MEDAIESRRLSTAVSYAALAGTSGYCLFEMGFDNVHLRHASYSLMLLNSVVGMLRNDTGNDVDNLSRFTEYLQSLFVIPCCTTCMWLSHPNGTTPEMAYAHVAAPVVPLGSHFAQNDDMQQLQKMIQALNIISMGVVSGMENSMEGLGATVAGLMAELSRSKDWFERIPSQDLHNYCMAVFAILASWALQEAK